MCKIITLTDKQSKKIHINANCIVEIIKMINALPNILDYSEHIDHFEQKIIRKKQDIEREQRRDFMDEFY